MIRALISLLFLIWFSPLTAGPLLTGVVEDVRAHTIEMPSLPGAWQRRIEWMATEGSEVAADDLIVRLDPGNLITEEEQNRTDLEKKRLSAARRVDELKLEVMDAERSAAEAASQVRLAQLDAVIPESTIARLDYERYQLELETARKAEVRAEAQLLNKQAELEDAIEETALEVAQAESSYQRIRRALNATEIRAEKSGFMIYGENPWTGQKIFPGETIYIGFQIASIASREDLQIRFWIHEADVLKVTSGMTVEVAADALAGQVFPARIVWTSSQAVEKQDWSNGRYFEALAEPLDGIPASVMPGMSVMGIVDDPEVGR